MTPVPDAVKRAARLLDACLAMRRRAIRFRDANIRVVNPRWWPDARQESFDDEIAPYFTVLRDSTPDGAILDAGAAVGLFSVAAGVAFPSASIVAFEPSLRQRVLLRRNLRMNGMAGRVDIVPRALWNNEEALTFRTHGAMSAVHGASSALAEMPFHESVRATTLDNWAKEHSSTKVGLIKMDIEGSEVEALQGAGEVLRGQRPVLLIQAYHLRDGKRTFETCAELLRGFGYNPVEPDACPGLIYAQSPH